MIVLALLSLLTGKALKPGIAGSSKIGWKGDILPVDDIRVKVLAAKDGGTTSFLMLYDPRQVTDLLGGISSIIVGTVADSWKMVTE